MFLLAIYLETLFLAASFLFRYLVAPSKTLTLLEARWVPRALPRDAHFVRAGTPSPTQREAGAKDCTLLDIARHAA
jgi:hypothetical protein